MGKDHWDAIAASAPLNTTAATVTAKGIHFVPAAETLKEETCWDGPPPLQSVTALLGNPSFVDLTGRRIGRLQVLGWFGDGLWACRCTCGRYVGRRAKGLKARPDDAMCNECNYTGHLRYAASGNRSKERAESEEARKW